MATTAPNSAGAAAADFDGLRREASKLERQLEDRISRYQQLAQRITTNDTTAGGGGVVAASAPGASTSLDSAEAGTSSSSLSSLFAEETSLSTDIDRVVSSFSDINDRMARAAERSKKNQHSVLVKRYREILFDFQSDFHKSKSNINRRRETMELFSNRNPGAGGGAGGGGMFGADGDTEHLLRERNAIDNSMNSAAAIINQAGEIHGDLRHQRRQLTGIAGTMSTITQTIPGMNYLMDAIRRRRNRDDWIVIGVVGGCCFFTFWYVFLA